MRWAIAAGIVQVAWVLDTKMNLADTMTKRLTVEARNRLLGDWTDILFFTIKMCTVPYRETRKKQATKLLNIDGGL